MGSPPIERGILILDFLTTHPGRGFTAAELSRRLGISRSTTHSILITMADRALVLRNPDTHEYRLGPALVPMGAVAERAFPALTHATAQARVLADDFDADCVVGLATSDELLIVGRAGVGGPSSVAYFEGRRLPLVPPWGTILYAWSDDHDVEAWLRRLGPELSDAERGRYRAALATARRQGYGVGVRVPALDEISRLQASEAADTPAGRREIGRARTALAYDHALLPIGEALPRDAEISSIAAPVFGPDGRPLLVIALLPLERNGVDDLPELARAVARAAQRITAAIDGRHPAGEAPAN